VRSNQCSMAASDVSRLSWIRILGSKICDQGIAQQDEIQVPHKRSSTRRFVSDSRYNLTTPLVPPNRQPRSASGALSRLRLLMDEKGNLIRL
jgi:hypothetical protein